ncbi:hypothetical protein GCM10011316_25100 [Roseibium aquae]|uniref:DUF721 domain-containing protein n=1 Tax=Roseibium aquae TaxID=1323746 RepID=A0A916TLA7_9HYPH|nr:DciA family protein [Roseibium aquae]GGB52068.1 hypothetical protein GCM10011316_25100 [Roseibium aquae]
MTANAGRSGVRRKTTHDLADLVGKAVTPACRKRGFASLDLLSAWPDIVGGRYGERVRPVRLIWPRQGRDPVPGEQDPVCAATLLVHADGPTALFLSHETGQILSRINAFFGWQAVERIKIVQKPVTVRKPAEKKTLRGLTEAEESALEDKLSTVGNDRLRAALKKLGAQVIAKSDD